MKCILKYTIYLLIITFIYSIFNRNLVEGLDDGAFPFLARIIGKNNDEKLDYKTDYIGCHNYECDNKIFTKNDFPLSTDELKTEIRNIRDNSSETDLTDYDLDSFDSNKLKEILVNIHNTRKYVKKDVTYTLCNNHMDYSPASSIIGDVAFAAQDPEGTYVDGRCNHELCCFDTKCSSKDNNDISANRCDSGFVLKKDAHCFTYEDCNDPEKFKEYCCESATIPPEINDLFNTIDTNSNDTISWDELSGWYNNIILNDENTNIQKLDKFLSITEGENKTLSRMDFKDLLTSN